MAIHKKYTKAYDILKNSTNDYNGEEPVKHIYNRFISEYSWSIQRYGFFQALVDWLQGLALDIPYTYHDIQTTFGLTEKQTESYWRFMAMRLKELFQKEGLIK